MLIEAHVTKAGVKRICVAGVVRAVFCGDRSGTRINTVVMELQLPNLVGRDADARFRNDPTTEQRAITQADTDMLINALDDLFLEETSHAKGFIETYNIHPVNPRRTPRGLVDLLRGHTQGPWSSARGASPHTTGRTHSVVWARTGGRHPPANAPRASRVAHVPIYPQPNRPQLTPSVGPRLPADQGQGMT